MTTATASVAIAAPTAAYIAGLWSGDDRLDALGTSSLPLLSGEAPEEVVRALDGDDSAVEGDDDTAAETAMSCSSVLASDSAALVTCGTDARSSKGATVPAG